MQLKNYQTQAALTSKLPLSRPEDSIAPMLGLAGETGAILTVYKRFLRDGLDVDASRAFLKEELGDLLWYLTAIATACGLDLDEIAMQNLQKTLGLYGKSDRKDRLAELPVLDEPYPPHERFPRLLVVHFSESEVNDRLTTRVRLIHAQPNPFPNGPIAVNGREVGFAVGEQLGASLTDNSRRADDYRYHDAIHFGFLAVLGWSPTLRSLLHLKRRSDPDVDEAEDGARAVFAEEGISAVLAQLANQRTGFRTESSVDHDAILVATATTADLEVAQIPAWVWRLAINQGFSAMRSLATHGGGYLIADLDSHSLEFSTNNPIND